MALYETEDEAWEQVCSDHGKKEKKQRSKFGDDLAAFVDSLGLYHYDAEGLTEEFEESLDSMGEVRVGEGTFPPSRILRELDKIAYVQSRLNFVSAFAEGDDQIVAVDD